MPYPQAQPGPKPKATPQPKPPKPRPAKPPRNGPAAKPAPAPKPAKSGKGHPIAHGLMRVANQQIKMSEAPILAQIRQEQAANLARAQAQMGFAKAAAALMQAAAPNVQQGYANAADANAGYAKGLGNITQSALDQNAQAQNDFLAKMGTPQAGLQQAPDVGGVAYGTQGFIPASTLQREGAAFGAAAQLAPGYRLAQGQQAAASELANDTNLQSLQAELAKIAATQPQVYQQLVQQAQEQRYKQAVLGQSQQRIGLEQQSLRLRAQEQAAMNAYRQASLGLSAERLRLAQRKDAAAIQAAIVKGHNPDSALSKIYGYIVDSHGQPILHNGKKIKVVKSSSASSSGLPPWSTGKKGRGNPNGAGSFGAGVVPSAYRLPAKVKATANNLVQLAREYLGTPYAWGGSSPSGFDCSGFAQYLYGKAGISIPRTTYTQWTAPNGRPVGKRHLQPGDLVYYKGSDSIVQNGKVLPGHVGIYIGHGKIIDAYGTGYGVRIDSVFSPMLGGYMGARRFLR